MAKTPKNEKPEDVETDPDSWERFQKTMDKIVPPKRNPKDEKATEEKGR
mgnify:FL=1|tara:strand:- start:1248 stop:1394 length:147 start_codon:yes stop_codon:yes gene_type:complete